MSTEIQGNSNNKLFKCQKCDKIYDIPKSLPCGNTICNICLLNDNVEKVIKCHFCENDHEVPVNGFPTNIILFQLMSMNMQSALDEKEEKKKDSIEKEINDIELNLNLLKEKSCSVVKSKFQDIRDEIIARSEYLAKSLYDYTEAFLNDIDLYESQLMNDMAVKDLLNEKFNELKKELEVESNNESLNEQVKSLNSMIKSKIEDIPNLSILDEEKFQYELSCGNLDRSVVCKLKLYDIIKFQKMNYKISDFKATISYKSNDLQQAFYDYKYFVSALDNEKIAVGLNLKLKSTTKTTTGFCYKLKVIIFDYKGQILNELPVEHEINQKFKQLEHFIAYKDFIYCSYIDCDMQYCLKIFNLEFKTVKDIKFNSIIKSLAISNDDSRIYALFNILNVNIFDLNFEKIGSFGQLIDENEPFYLESAKEMLIQNDKIYLRLNNDKFIRVLDRCSGVLLKTIEIELENCSLQVNKLEKIVLVNRLEKKLLIYDENGKLVCENELINIQNVSSFFITNENLFVVNDFLAKQIYVF